MVEAKSSSRVWAVRKLRGTPRQRVGWKAHDRGMLCSCSPEVYQPPVYGFSLYISRGYSYGKNSQPVTSESVHTHAQFLRRGCSAPLATRTTSAARG